MAIFNKDMEHDANIRLRPLNEQEYLYFPFAWHEGGHGYAVPYEHVDAYKKRYWSPFGFVMAPTLLITGLALLLGRGNWFVLIAGVVLGLFLGYKLLQVSKKQNYKMLAALKQTDHHLSRGRYYQEMALQKRPMTLWVKLLFWGLLLFFLLANLKQVALGGATPLFFFMGLSAAVLKIRHTWHSIYLRQKADGDEVGSLKNLDAPQN